MDTVAKPPEYSNPPIFIRGITGTLATPVRETFDIFEGDIRDAPIWVACAEGIAAAKATMDEIAATKPGQYFVWETRTRKVLAMIDTGAKKKTA